MCFKLFYVYLLYQGWCGSVYSTPYKFLLFFFLSVVCFMYFGDTVSNVFKTQYEIHCLSGSYCFLLLCFYFIFSPDLPFFFFYLYMPVIWKEKYKTIPFNCFYLSNYQNIFWLLGGEGLIHVYYTHHFLCPRWWIPSLFKIFI